MHDNSSSLVCTPFNCVHRMCETGLSTMIGYIYAPQVWNCVCVCFVTLLYLDFVNFLNIFLYYIWSISFLIIFLLGAGVFGVRLYLSSVRWRKKMYSLNNSVSTFSYGVEFKARHFLCQSLGYFIQSKRLSGFPLLLTHWGRDKMAAFFQTTFSNDFSWMKMYEFWLTFHWSLFLGVQLTIFQHWFRLWLGADQATSHYLNQWWLDYRRIYA